MANRSYRYGENKHASVSAHFFTSCCGKATGAKLENPDFWLGVFFLFLLFAYPVSAGAQTYLFDIPQQRADIALTALADQADISVVFDYDVVRQYQASRLIGTFPVSEAVAELLKGTPLVYELSSSGHLVVTKFNNSNGENVMTNTKRNGFFASVLGFLVGTSAVLPATAQDTGGQAQTRTIEEILVTARKREESSSEVPVAISAFTEKGLEDAAIENLDELLNMTAGTVYSDTNGNRATAGPGIRGITGGSVGGTTRISTFIDGMPMIGSQASINFVDVVGVELYRGPQSAVFGRSVFAGAINYTLRKPDLTEVHGGLNGQLGTDSRSALSGWASTPIVEDMLAVGVSYAQDSYGGPGEIKSTDGYDMGTRDTEHYSVALAFEPTDAISMNLRYTTTKIDDGSAADYNLDPADHPDQYVGAAQNYDVLGNRITGPGAPNFAPMYYGQINIEDDPVLSRNFCYHEGLADQNCIKDPGWEMERTRLAFDVDYAMDSGASLSFKTYSSDDTLFDIDDQDNTDEAIVAMSLVNMGTDTDISESYYEVVWTSPDADRLRYTLGYSQFDYDYYNAAYFIHPSAQSATGTPNLPGVTTQTVKNNGIFGGVFYDLNDQFTVSFEARQQHDEIAAEDPDPTDNNVPEAISDTFLPRVSLKYAYSDDLNFYLQYAEGAQPATINNQAVGTIQRAVAEAMDGLVVGPVTLQSAIPFLDSVLAVDEEKIKNYEIGMKGQFLENRLSLNAALFLIKTDSYAQSGNLWFYPTNASVVDTIAAIVAANPTDPLLNSNLQDTSFRVQGAINTGNLKSTGLELEGTYLLDDHWSIGGQFTYLDTTFDEGCDFGGSTFGTSDSTLPVAGGAPIDCTDVAGNKVTYVPEIQLGASATYEAQLSNGRDWFARLDVRYEDQQYVDTYNNSWLPSSTKVNLRAGINIDNVRLEAYIENLTDDNTPAGAQYEPDRKEVQNYFMTRPPAGSTGINVAIATPREFGVRASYSF